MRAVLLSLSALAALGETRTPFPPESKLKLGRQQDRFRGSSKIASATGGSPFLEPGRRFPRWFQNVPSVLKRFAPRPQSAIPVRDIPLAQNWVFFDHGYEIIDLDSARGRVSYFQSSNEQTPHHVEALV
jgi:hypothetical protein